ncbi:MAG: glycine cleavage system protein T [Gammaproteobacteria bacterium]|nr:glycine cleavage system protein T [Gammaproteobacteria bacterium]
MGLKTKLFEKHIAANARIIDFGGWNMPLHYGSQKQEHLAVRQSAGIFDVSHMTIIDLSGERVREFLQYLVAGDIKKLKDYGNALYTVMLNCNGGIVDDLIIYFISDKSFRLVTNSATRKKDLTWIQEQAYSFNILINEREDLSMIAVQGPHARELASECLSLDYKNEALLLKPFNSFNAGNIFVARTGYTGEDGFELCISNTDAPKLWDQLLSKGITPCGLGARDTLRLEAALNLYGTDMNEFTSPLESGLSWTIGWNPKDRNFIGRKALEELQSSPNKKQFVGLILEDMGVLRNGQKVLIDEFGDGEITSGGFSPSTGRSIALARLPAGEYDHVKVKVRNKTLKARIVDTPFVYRGEIKIDIKEKINE